MFWKNKTKQQAPDSKDKFWGWFSENAPSFVPDENGYVKPHLLAELGNRLQQAAPLLSVEVGREASGMSELIITAQGDTTLFPAAFEIVRSAPPIENWRVNALAPPLGVGMIFENELLTLNSADLFFQIGRSEKTPLLGLFFVISDFDPQLEEAYSHALWILVSAVIGEWLTGESIGFIGARAPDPNADDPYALSELESIVRHELAAREVHHPFEPRN